MCRRTTKRKRGSPTQEEIIRGDSRIVGRDAAETERFFISIHAAGNADRKKQKKKIKKRREGTKQKTNVLEKRKENVYLIF